MNYELIRNLILRILEEPEMQQLLQGKISAEPSASKALILLEEKVERKNLLLEWAQLWSEEYHLFVCVKEDNPVQEFELLSEISSVTIAEALAEKNWRHIFLPNCSADTLAKAALGIQDTPFNRLITWGICQGIPISLSAHDLGFGSKTPEPYRKLFHDYIQRLTQYGVQILSSPEEQPRMHYKKKLLAECDAFNLPPETILSLPKGTIISPLARDTLKQKQIKLLLETEGQI